MPLANRYTHMLKSECNELHTLALRAIVTASPPLLAYRNQLRFLPANDYARMRKCDGSLAVDVRKRYPSPSTRSHFLRALVTIAVN